MGEEIKSTDVFGIAPYGEALKITTEETLMGIGQFLGVLCMPAAQEMGLMLHDNFKFWRLKNILRILEKARGNLDFDVQTSTLRLHPKIGIELLESGSKEDSDEIQNYWAGLLVSSLSDNGKDESGLLYLSILNQLTCEQVKIINYACSNAKIAKDQQGLIYADQLLMNYDQLKTAFGIMDIHKLDRILDHLRALGLTHGGFFAGSTNLTADVAPSALAIHFYVRCQGTSKNPVEYFNLK